MVGVIISLITMRAFRFDFSAPKQQAFY